MKATSIIKYDVDDDNGDDDRSFFHRYVKDTSIINYDDDDDDDCGSFHKSVKETSNLKKDNEEDDDD